MAKPKAHESAEPKLAWWLPSYLREHPPRIPAVEQRFTPSKREDDPHPPVTWPLPPLVPSNWTPVARVSKFALYALEVLDAKLLHELLHLRWLEDDDQRYFVGPDGEGWESAWRVADENVKLVKAAMDRDRKMLKANPEVTSYIDHDGRPRNINLKRDEDELAYLRATRDRYRDTTTSSTKAERQASRERLLLLVDILHRQAGWLHRDVAELIIAAETDWTRPPIKHIDERRDDGDLAGNLERWIIECVRGR